MRIIFTLLVVLFSLLSVRTVQAQDPRLSQFYAAPLQMNPAMIGLFEGRSRFVANYRELYPAILDNNPYRTMAASFDMRFRMQNDDYLGLGVSALRDEVGVANFNRTNANVGLSFLKQLGGSRYTPYTQYLIAGAQLGFGQHGMNWQRLWFSEQFDAGSGTINTGAPNGEDFDGQLSTDPYLDFNAGLLWYILFEDNLSLYFGGALHHLNAPSITFLETGDASLDMRWVGQAGGEFPLTKELSFLPAAAVMGQGEHLSITTGGNFRYTNRDWREVAIRAGAWVHVANQLEQGMSMDAFVVTTFLEMERWNIGLSYDVTTSVLARANNSRGAFEVSFMYTQPANWRTNVKCPNF